ncbi:hypothetical protein [Agromyces humatus]|uniref:Uncharacterized protein n=1 Tax=Agromyces humatus TaxID=279573 RepID=A0ABP4WSX0_9MICO|nr:hypothetical protein [Agromyces humatus]
MSKCPNPGARQFGRVLCEADSGDELARSNVFPKMTTGILVTLGFGGLQYDLSAEGHVIGLEVVPTPATASPSPSPSPSGG